MRQAIGLVLAVLLPLAVGALGSLPTFGAVRDWYPTLVRPSFAPPTWVFGPVWSTLYAMMGVASWLVWRQGVARPGVRTALTLYAVQLAFNFAWSWLFFGMRRPFLALLEILVLLALVGATAVRFAAASRGAALLMAPYFAWVAFAALLNGGFWWLNRS
jgi:benzodiazapine receptor